MLLAIEWYHGLLAFLFAFAALVLIGTILLQRGRGGGLSGAFGGGGGAAVFGSKTGDVLTWATVVLAVLFLFFTVGLNFVFRPEKADLVVAPPTIPVSGAIDLAPGAPDEASESLPIAGLDDTVADEPASTSDEPPAPSDAEPDDSDD